MGRLGRKQTVDSNLTAIHQSPKSLPSVFPPKEKKAFVIEKKWLQWRFRDWFHFPVWKLACFGVDNLIMVCACVSLWPISVVLLDTTSVLGELGWKAYPINGVRMSFFDFSFFFHFVHGNFFFFLNRVASATSVSSLDYLGGLFHPCFEMETDNEPRPLLLSSPLTDWKMIVNNEAISLYQKKNKAGYVFTFMANILDIFRSLRLHRSHLPTQNFCESSRHRTGDIGMMKYRCADN